MKTLLIVLGLAVAAGGGYWFITKNKSPKPVPGQLPPAPPNKPLPVIYHSPPVQQGTVTGASPVLNYMSLGLGIIGQAGNLAEQFGLFDGDEEL